MPPTPDHLELTSQLEAEGWIVLLERDPEAPYVQSAVVSVLKEAFCRWLYGVTRRASQSTPLEAPQLTPGWRGRALWRLPRPPARLRSSRGSRSSA